jgi:hypothetical protein
VFRSAFIDRSTEVGMGGELPKRGCHEAWVTFDPIVALEDLRGN